MSTTKLKLTFAVAASIFLAASIGLSIWSGISTAGSAREQVLNAWASACALTAAGIGICGAGIVRSRRRDRR